MNFYKFINYKKLFSKYLRFHYYSEIFELTNEYKKIGIEGIFTTDKKEILYRFNNEKKRLIKKFGYFSNDEINFIKTQFRIENFSLKNLSKKHIIKLFEKSLKDYGFIIIYVHEYDLYSYKTLKYLDITLDILLKDLKIKCFDK